MLLLSHRSDIVYEDADEVNFGAYLKHRRVERWTLEGMLHEQEGTGSYEVSVNILVITQKHLSCLPTFVGS